MENMKKYRTNDVASNINIFYIMKKKRRYIKFKT